MRFFRIPAALDAVPGWPAARPHARGDGEGGRMSLQDRHIAVVVAALGAGGAERVIAWLAAEWLAEGARVTVITFDAPDDPIYHALPEGVRCERLGIAARSASPGSAPRGLIPPPLRRVAALRRALRRLRPDVAISFLTKVNVLCLAASIGAGIPVIAAERNNPERQQAHWIWGAALARLYGRARLIVCQTQASVRTVPPRYRDRVKVIPNPVLPARGSARSSDGRRHVVGVGRLEAQKGFDLLIDAFARVADVHPGWTLDLWGAGPDEALLRARIEAAALSGRIRLRGLSDRPGGWIAEADMFVLSSRFEGFPNVLGEAMAAGLPVIAADCAFGPSELVTHEVDGLLVEAESAHAIAVALDRMMADGDLRARLAGAAPRVATLFAPERVARGWKLAVNEALSRR